MVPSTTDIGTSTKRAEKGSFITSMAMFTRATGKETKQAATEYTQILKDLGMKALGRTISSTAKAMKPGLRELATRAITTVVKRKAAANTPGQTDLSTKGSGSIIKSTATESTSGQMEGNIMVSGKVMTCRDMGYICILTVLGMMGSITTTKKMDTGFTTGPMDASTRVGGTRESNTGSDSTLIL